MADLADQVAQRQEVDSAKRSLTEERLRIARELHDVVAHSLSVIAVQSGVGHHVIDRQPNEARKALAAVETTSRAALDELRRMLGVLRHDDVGLPTLAPAPCIADVPRLVEEVRAVRVPVDLDLGSTPAQRARACTSAMSGSVSWWRS
ncbi:MAG: sensor histidine kinase [Actinomycetes bacterium]